MHRRRTQKTLLISSSVVSFSCWFRNGPDCEHVADTVVLTLPPEDEDAATGWRPEVLEKPTDKDDQKRMLLDLNGRVCEVVTGVSLSACLRPFVLPT
jgi:hypothetical protein